MECDNSKKIEAIDLFCGIGGLSFGLKQAGIDIKAGLDNDDTCRYTYEANNQANFIHADIEEYDFHQLKDFYDKDAVKVLVGCAPCQPFSTHTTKEKKIENKDDDKRWNLINYFLKAVEAVEPDFLSMENVTGIIKTEIFQDFVKGLETLGYTVTVNRAYCPNYGVPQSRRRLVLLGAKNCAVPMLKETHTQESYPTVKTTIGHLTTIKAGECCEDDKLHRAQSLNNINLQRIQQSKPNGTWKDWDKELLPKCYKKESGKTYKSVYGRMDWNKVSPTLTTLFTTYGTGRYGHPQQDRALSVREGALLQTFPPQYDFGKEIHYSRIVRHIGNAVPPKLGEAIGLAIKNSVIGTNQAV